MKRRILSFVMALVMILSMLPTAAFAADKISLVVGTATADPGKTVSVDVSIAGADMLAIAATYLELDFASDLTLNSVTLSGNAVQAGFAFGQNNLSEGVVQIEGPLSGTNISDGVFFTMEFTASNSASGTYPVSIAYLDGVEDSVHDGENAVPCTFTAGSITVGESTLVTDAYTAELENASSSTVKVDENVTVNVLVGGTVGEFASAEVTLTYDSNYLTFNEDESSLNDAGVDTTTENTIKLIDHGETNPYPIAYELRFTAKEATGDATTAVTLTDARFSTAENAISANLIEATGENALDLTITEADLNVTLPTSGVVTGNSTVPYGGDYTFTAKNNTTYMYYDYVVSATMGGNAVPAGNIVNNGDGTWTIANITGDLVISVTETPKNYNVTVKGDGNTVTDVEVEQVTTSATEGKAPYGTDLTYTLPAGQDVDGTEDGYHYTATVTVGGNSYTASGNGLNYTIAGTAVTGDIVITLSKAIDAADSVLVKIEDSNEIQKDGQYVTEFNAKKNSVVTLTLVPEAGYSYVINDGTNNLTISNNTFTVNVGESPVTITVTKTLDLTSVNVQNYLSLNGTTMWLVTINGNGNGTTEINGKTYSYEGNNMFWSSKYQAYCYLDVETSLNVENAKDNIGEALVEADAIDVEYNMDVNNTNGVVDANDAQLVYNMYQTKAYDNFGTVNMIKFLEADLNATVGVNSTDAQVIINNLLNITN